MDMLTDRCSTTGLLFVLSQEYSSLSNPTDIPSSIWSMVGLIYYYISKVFILSHVMLTHTQYYKMTYFFLSSFKKNQNNHKTFLFLILLDISSHWAQTYSSALLQQHHKSSDANAQNFFLVRLYYQIYLFFGYCCVGTEFTYIALYTYARLYYHDDDNNNDWIDFVYKFLLVCGPACVVKQIVNVSQLCSACHGIATNDANNKMKDS